MRQRHNENQNFLAFAVCLPVEHLEIFLSKQCWVPTATIEGEIWCSVQLTSSSSFHHVTKGTWGAGSEQRHPIIRLLAEPHSTWCCSTASLCQILYSLEPTCRWAASALTRQQAMPWNLVHFAWTCTAPSVGGPQGYPEQKPFHLLLQWIFCMLTPPRNWSALAR